MKTFTHNEIVTKSYYTIQNFSHCCLHYNNSDSELYNYILKTNNNKLNKQTKQQKKN